MRERHQTHSGGTSKNGYKTGCFLNTWQTKIFSHNENVKKSTAYNFQVSQATFRLVPKCNIIVSETFTRQRQV